MGPYGYGYGDGGMMGYGWGISDTIVHVLWIIILVMVVVWLLRRVFGIRHGGRHMRHWEWPGSSALDILKERYAKGEINKEEFEEKKLDLEK